MIHLLRESVAPGTGTGTGTGRPLVKLVTARSLGNCAVGSEYVGNLKSRGRALSNFEKKRDPDPDPVGKKQIDFPDFFNKIKAQLQMKKNLHKKKRTYGPVFTGM